MASVAAASGETHCRRRGFRRADQYSSALIAAARRYDAQGLPSEFSVDNDAAIAYAYDGLKRLTNISVGGLAFGCAYLPQPRMQVSASNSCGSGWSRSYEGGRRMTGHHDQLSCLVVRLLGQGAVSGVRHGGVSDIRHGQGSADQSG